MLILQATIREVKNNVQPKRHENEKKYIYVDINKLGFSFGSSDFVRGDSSILEDKAGRIVFGFTKGGFKPTLIMEGELVKWAILLSAGEESGPDRGVYRVDIEKLRGAHGKVRFLSAVSDFEKWIKIINTATHGLVDA